MFLRVQKGASKIQHPRFGHHSWTTDIPTVCASIFLRCFRPILAQAILAQVLKKSCSFKSFFFPARAPRVGVELAGLVLYAVVCGDPARPSKETTSPSRDPPTRCQGIGARARLQGILRGTSGGIEHGGPRCCESTRDQPPETIARSDAADPAGQFLQRGQACYRASSALARDVAACASSSRPSWSCSRTLRCQCSARMPLTLSPGALYAARVAQSPPWPLW